MVLNFQVHPIEKQQKKPEGGGTIIYDPGYFYFPYLPVIHRSAEFKIIR
jgi:hypothetical protein